MKKYNFFHITIGILILMGCYQAPSMDMTEFAGTWVRDSGGDIITLNLTRTTFNISMTGGTFGTVMMNINSYDESLNHILTVVTSSTSGLVSDFPIGTTFPWTYVIVGNQLWYDYDESGSAYPDASAATFGPFIKQ